MSTEDIEDDGPHTGDVQTEGNPGSETGPNNTTGEIRMSTPKSLISANQTDVFVQNQNTYGAAALSGIAVAAGHTAVVLVHTAEALTDETLAALFDGTGESAEILAQDNVPEAEGYSAALEGRLHVKYTRAAANSND